jgi:hypothetical protein
MLATTGTTDMFLGPVRRETGLIGPTKTVPKHSGTGIGASADTTPQTPTEGVTPTRVRRNAFCLDILLTGGGNLAIETTGPDLEKMLVITLGTDRVVRYRDYERQVRTTIFTTSLRIRIQRWNLQE